jgi:hypothetical protein
MLTSNSLLGEAEHYFRAIIDISGGKEDSNPKYTLNIKTN